MRRKKAGEGLTEFSVEDLSEQIEVIQSDWSILAARRGPHTELADAQLHTRRDQLVNGIEGYWGEIGWELRTCKRPEDLIRIFQPLTVSNIQGLVFSISQPSLQTASTKKLRETRSALRAQNEPRRLAEAEWNRTRDHLKDMNSVRAQAKGRSHRMIKRGQKRSRKDFAAASKEFGRLREKTKTLEQQLADLEGSFSRRELFRFLKSKRYSLTPLNLANALAGIPYMGWRQSMRRATRSKCPIANGFPYQVFKSIQFLVAKANKKTANSLVGSLRDSIPSLPSRYRLARKSLAKDWLFLQRATRQSHKLRLHPKALPFEITKRYFKQTQSRSQTDIAWAEQAQLDLSRRKGTLKNILK